MVKICIDAGHYGKQNPSPIVAGYYEAEAMWKLHLYLREELMRYNNIEVITTREYQVKNLGLTSRGQASKGCDLFLSLHSNACDDARVDRVVIIATVNGKANDIGRELMMCINAVMGINSNPQFYSKQQSDGRDWYGVLRGCASVGVGGLILEHSFHTNEKATLWLMNDENLRRLAQHEARAIANYYGCVLKDSEHSEFVDNFVDNVDKCEELYKVVAGSYTKRSNADTQLALLTHAGFSAYIRYINNKYRIYVGSYKNKAGALDLIERLKMAGFESFVTSEATKKLTIEKKSVEEVAQEVVRGIWGVYPKRKELLEKAGYNYEAVRIAVNRIMGK